MGNCREEMRFEQTFLQGKETSIGGWWVMDGWMDGWMGASSGH